MKHSDDYIQAAEVIGNLPPFYRVAEAIRGCGVDFDSDGDSSTPEDTNWRELTLTQKSCRGVIVDGNHSYVEGMVFGTPPDTLRMA